jgi:hypothetical protein
VTDAPDLSVLIPTRRGWAAAERSVRSFAAEVDPAVGEVVVVDGSRARVPDELPAGVRWVRRDGGSVFQLRETGYREVRGAIVAVTEDHCRAAPGWADALRRAYREHPDAIGVIGSVRNGTPEHAIDRGAFYITQTPFLAPLPTGPLTTIAGPNVSYRREVIERMRGRADMGMIELLDNPNLRREGEWFVADDRVVVYHDQHFDLRTTSALEFHNGRTVAGFQRLRARPKDVLRVLLAPILPLYRATRAVRQVRGREGSSEQLRTAVPAILWLQYCFGAGELLGYLAGPGDSPSQLN